MSLAFNKQDGLIPAIIVDDVSGDVLMLGYMNEAAYQLTVSSGHTWFYSRSRNELWHKGATSGQYQRVKHITSDCDEDTLLIRVEQLGGGACHTGATSCFFNNISFTASEGGVENGSN
ncbi:phosphoribosyl-AMP cyclohydrolase [Brochothrix campestris]|uniref:Phosphoribosyl-AMP cyclohydrolase n=1 Tax=Brochothrix campestris FSL F6-1037 TaxID=1265861 RepID=W7CJ57_9LIST|nr:phosphoribosyl-AMP cyclohydrolase [Brochothrix campestris]EUJ37007.1 phosphoribosyl-AMP cyclohydrolase [Brochothrix campestris FSL F6-1037]